MSVFEATFTEYPSTPSYPSMAVLAAFSSDGTMAFAATGNSVNGDPLTYDVAAVGDLLVLCIHYGIPGGYDGWLTFEESAGNVWHSVWNVSYTDDSGVQFGMQIYWAIAVAAGSTTVTVAGMPSGEEDGYAFGSLVMGEFSTTVGTFALDSFTFGEARTGQPSLTLETTTGTPLLVADCMVMTPSGDEPILGAEQTYYSAFFNSQAGMDSSSISVYTVEATTYSSGGTPPPANPLRYKRLPLKLDFASCSFDQADRLLMYELYRACGLDPSNPFLATLLGWDTPPPWQPPITLSLTVWGEAVDEMWNILKSGMASSDTVPGPICGKVITIDSVNYPEWCGDWEIVQCEYAPFSGQAAQNYGSQSGGEVTGSSELIGAPAEGSGMLSLTLRTYNPSVFFDASMTPSWIDVPGPWADGSY